MCIRDSPGGGDKERYYTVNDIISNSPEMIKIKDSISQVAQTDSSVLIYGETGTGKEMIAQAIHSASKRTKKKFVVQNCAAIPATLLEGILFGTVRGDVYKRQQVRREKKWVWIWESS